MSFTKEQCDALTASMGSFKFIPSDSDDMEGFPSRAVIGDIAPLVFINEATVAQIKMQAYRDGVASVDATAIEKDRDSWRREAMAARNIVNHHGQQILSLNPEVAGMERQAYAEARAANKEPA